MIALIDQTFDGNELRDVCIDFNISYENLLGENKRGKVRALVGLFERRNTLDVLLDWVSGKRENVDWPSFPKKRSV